MTESKGKIFWRNFKKVFNILTDVLLYPIIFLSMIIGFNAMTSKQQYEVKTYFGYSVVTVMSGSMTEGGFDIGDVVFLKTVNTDDLRPMTEDYAGDIIAFYNYKDVDDPSSSELTRITDFNAIPDPTSEESVVGDKTKQDAIDAKKLVLFHRIIGVYVAEDGTRFFQTKGDSNPSPDTTLIREDFVVGRYLNAPRFLEQAFTFMSSTDGIIYIVIVPLSILIFFQIIEVVTMIFAIITERKVIAGEIPFDCDESIKANVGKEMRDFDKIYFYDISPPKDKERVEHFLWGYLKEPQSSVKDKKYYQTVETSINLYKKSRSEYWKYWVSREKNGRKLTKLINLQKIANILAKTTEVNKANAQRTLAGRALPKRPLKVVESPGMQEIKRQTKQEIKNLSEHKKDNETKDE